MHVKGALGQRSVLTREVVGGRKPEVWQRAAAIEAQGWDRSSAKATLHDASRRAGAEQQAAVRPGDACRGPVRAAPGNETAQVMARRPQNSGGHAQQQRNKSEEVEEAALHRGALPRYGMKVTRTFISNYPSIAADRKST